MPTILDYYKYAALATAAYVRLGEGPYSGTRLVTLAATQSDGRFPESIGEKLFIQSPTNPSVWTIGSYHGRDVPGYNDNTGFAATLFKKDGENVLAIRGLEPTFLTLDSDEFYDANRDVAGASVGGIGLLGVAVNQVVDLVNLVLRLYGKGPVTQLRAEVTLLPPPSGTPGTLAVQLPVAALIPTTDERPPVVTPLFLSLSTYEADGMDVLAAGDKITLIGHSLGGHLAVAAAPLLGNRINWDVYAFNSPGFDPASVDLDAAGLLRVFHHLNVVTETLIFVAKSWLAESLGLGAELLPSSAQQASASILAGLGSLLNTPPLAFTVHNLESEDSTPGDDQSVVASVLTGVNELGPKKFIGTERNSHSIEQIMDALALQAVLYRLDNSLDLPALKKFVDAAHYLPGSSEEVLVEALHSLLIPGSRFSANKLHLAVSDAAEGLDLWIRKGNIDARNEFHTALLEINQHLDSAGLGPTRIVSMTEEAGKPLTVDQSLQRATTGSDALAYRYALMHLLPFAVLGLDYQSLHNASGELDLYDPDATVREGGLTDSWIRERARLLVAVNARNTQDTADSIAWLPFEAERESEYHYFADGKEQVLFGQPTNWTPGGLPTEVVQFADDTGRYLLGSDYLVGDTIFGGSGADYIVGKGKDDRLEGGRGMDVYAYDGRKAFLGALTNDGNDTILDTDGNGVLRYTFTEAGLLSNTAQTTVIAEATINISDTEWQSADGKFTYSKIPNDKGRTDLIIIIAGDAGGSLTLQDWREGDFGIHLWDARVTPEIASSILGDLEPQDFDPATPGTQTQTDILGNVIVTSAAEPDRDDVLFGNRPDVIVDPAAAGQRIEAGGGHDLIFSDRPRGEADNGLGDADWVIAGAGRDIIETGAGADLIEAGPDGVLDAQAGGDIADAGAGDDEIYSETKVNLAEALRAGNEDAPTNLKGDLLSGADGDDWIVGARANDLLLGGSGQDLILGGVGDDDIWGDADLISYTRGWQVERIISVDGKRVTYTTNVTGAVITDGVAGAGDAIYAGAGTDWIFAGEGDDFVDAGLGDDVSFGEAGSDILIGGSGDDVLAGDNPGEVGAADEGGDYLDGGEGDDQLFGGGGEDILIGGPGNDTLSGGQGRDVYLFNKGDGNDTVVDTLVGIDHPEAALLILGDGFSRSDVRFRLGSLCIDLGPVDPSDPNSARDQIHFEGFDPFDPLATPVLGEIRFASGESMTYADILAQGFDIEGTEEDDDAHDATHPILIGTAVTDRIRGLGGNDIVLSAAGDDILDGGSGDDHLQAGDGNDILIGGPGADVLQGEAGQDTYVADFEDTINDTSGGDLIDLSVATPEELTVARFDFNGQAALVISLSADIDPTQGLTILGDITTQDLRFAFASGDLTSDEFFDIAFTSSLNLTGTDDDDTLRGFGGADTLDGLAGNDSLHGGAGNDLVHGGYGDDTLNGGAGNDVLSGEAGGDTYLFGHGSGQDEVNDAGGDGIDLIVLSADILRQDVFLERSVDGNLTLTLSPDDRLTVTGHYSDEANRVEEIAFGDGTVLTLQDLNAVPLPPIMGTENADSLVGTNSPETLFGLGGDDTLDGGGGNDIVEGGGGIDTYAFGLGMGQDAFIDNGGRIVLRPGLAFNELSAVQRGDDLVLTIRGTTSGASLQDYFLSAQNWIIEDAVVLQTTPEAVLDATAQRAADWVGAQRDDYRAALKEEIASRYVSFGYIPTAEGTFFLPWQARPSLGGVTASAFWSTQTETRTISFFSGPTSTNTTTSGFTSWNNTIPLIIDSTVQITEETLVSNDAEIYPLGGSMRTDEFFPIVANVSWEGLQGDFGTVSELTRTEFIFGGEIDPHTGQPIAIGTVTTTTVFRNFSGIVNGQVTAIAPGATAQGGVFPTFINATLGLNTITEHISEIIAGPGDNEIFDGSLIDAGDGDDVASGGFVYGGAGDDIIDGEVAIGGPGNDWVSGTTIYGGPGDDYLEGGFGPSRIVFTEMDSGRDSVTDTQGLEIEEFADWYYTSIGILDWEDRLFDPDTEDHVDIEQGIELGLLPALPSIAPNDYAALEPLYAAGLIEKDALELGPGTALSDLALSWETRRLMSPRGDDFGPYALLNLEISADNVVSLVIPRSSDLLGVGIEAVHFVDGTAATMDELIALAPPAPDFDPEFVPNGGPVFLFEPGDGVRFIDDPGVTTIEFGAGITADMLTLGLGSLVIRVGGQGDEIHLVNFNPNDAFASQIEKIVFADGTELAYGELIARGFDIFGADGDDFLSGTNATDRLHGGAGNDFYFFYPETGFDVIEDEAGDFDTVYLAGETSPDEIAITRGGDFLTLELGSTNRIAIRWQPEAGYQIEQLLFNGGAALDAAALESMATVPNTAPALANAIPDQSAQEDEVFSFTLSADAFTDADADDVLSMTATVADGTSLPVWLVFDTATRSFNGTPANDDVGSLDVLVTATDRDGLSAEDIFTVMVVNTNDAPYLVDALSDQFSYQNAPFDFVVGDATFIDVDAGDLLTLASTLADGASLPGWLEFDATTRRFSGTPGEDDVGLHSISVTATDGAGATATGTFDLTISDAAITFASYDGTKRADVIRTGFDNDVIDAGGGDDTVSSGAGRDLILAGKGDDHVYGRSGNDYLFGGKGRDRLYGEAGSDVLLGEHGDDHLDGGVGNDVLDGGKGKDVLVGGAGNNLFIGGPGSDIFYGGSAHDIFLINRDDGNTTLCLGDLTLPGNTDTLSLGADITADDIVLRRKKSDLIVKVDESDDNDDSAKIVLRDWYRSGEGRGTITRLQLIGERIEIYDFTALVARFETATGGRERHWHAGPAMSEVLLSTDSSEAIGGALAYQYATHGSLADVSAPTIQATLADPLFGESPQSFEDGGGPTLAPFLAKEGDEDSGADEFVSLLMDSGAVNGPLPVVQARSDGVLTPPHSWHQGGKKGHGADYEDRWEPLIESWFGGTQDRLAALNTFFGERDSWRGGHDRNRWNHRHPTRDEIAAAWRRTKVLLEAHLFTYDPAAFGGGEGCAFSAAFGGLDNHPHSALSGERLSRVSGHYLRRLEGLEEGLNKLSM